MTRLFGYSAIAAAALFTACGGEDLVLPGEGEPAAITVVQGDGQSGRVGETLPQPLVFRVTDETGRPVPGTTVVVDISGAVAEPDTATTDGDGHATVGVVLGGTVGTASGSAHVPTPDDQAGISTQFTLSAVAASANGLRVVSGADQTGPAGTALPEPLVVQVTDAFGNPIPGVPITWTADGGGTVSEATTSTDAQGLTSVTRTLGTTAGQQRTLASSSQELAGSPAVFLHNATAGSAAGVQIVSGDGQTGPPGAALAAPLVVKVTDADGNPVTGAAVTWVVTAGGGQLTPSTSTTDAAGSASTSWTLGPAVGANAAQAVVSGVGSATFTATAAAGTASGVAIVSGDGQKAQAGARLPAPVVVRVTDGAGNPVAGAAVQWQVRSGGGTATPASGTTDANGTASAQWTLGPSVGENTLEALAGPAGSVTFRATATVGAASVLALTTQPSSQATLGVPFDRQPVVQLRDASGNNVAQAGVAVTAALASGSGTLAGTATRSTDASGRATFTDLAIGGTPGSHTIIFAASSFTSVTSSAISVGLVATNTRITADSPDPSAPGAGVTVQFEVTSSAGTPTGPVRVTTSAGSESCTADVAAGSCVIALGVAGSHTLTATYAGQGVFQGSSGTESHQVEAPNAAPSAGDDAFTVATGATLDVPAPGVLGNDTDPDGDPLTVAVVTGPAAGTLALDANGAFRYTPAAAQTGAVTFTYRASDGRGGEATATVTITVQ